MAVIIRETRILGGKEFPGRKVYKSDKFVTAEIKKQADTLDLFLQNKAEEIRGQLRESSLLRATSKKDILKLRHEIGKQLDFTDDPKIVHPDDKKFIWRALFDHAGDLAPGPPDERANKRPETSFFCYCHRLGKLPREMVEAGGDWSSWQRFFDLAIKRDERILNWLGQNRNKLRTALKKDWLKRTTKLLTEQFHNRDTTLLSAKELNKELGEILSKTS